jgi:multiple sugar transport system substrate-binding protein
MKKKNHLLKILIVCALMAPIFCFSQAFAEITITYSDWQLSQDIWGQSLREAIAEFERLNPGIKVTTEPVALGQRDVKFTTAIRGGKGPDVFASDGLRI